MRYTYYCVTSDCGWDTIEIGDAIPNPPTYTMNDNTLTIDDDMLFELNFDCNGNIINIVFTDSNWKWWRIGTNPDNCE